MKSEMVVLLGGVGGGTTTIADGDHVTPFLLKERGYHFPIAVMRWTFPEGQHYSAVNGAPLISVEWNEEWSKEMRDRIRAAYLEDYGACPKRIVR